MAAKFELELQQAIKNGIVTGAALYSVDKHGKTLMEKSFGKSGAGADAKDMSSDTTMWIASSTKLLTSISALQLVEQKNLSLDEPVASILPELANLQIITGFNETTREPILKPATKPITLRRLLSHSSGLGYDVFNPLLMKYRQHLGLPPSSQSLQKKHISTLLFEPGEGWEYSIGIDWAGIMVERSTGLSLHDYMRVNIWERLGMKSTTFRPFEREDVMDRLHDMVTRAANGKVINMDKDDQRFALQKSGFDSGGGGLVSCATDYSKVIRSLTINDGVLLQKETVDTLLSTPVLEPKAKQMMQGLAKSPISGPIFSVGLKQTREGNGVFDHGLASAICLSKVEGETEEGMLYWGGLPNNNWYIDREAGVGSFWATWIVPPGDVETGELFGKFRKAMYEEATRS